jgi:hypothetical protein
MEITKPIKIGNYWTNLVDSVTGESVNYEVVTKWWDDTDMSDAKADGVVYRKLPASVGGGYVRRVYDNFGQLFLEKDTMAEMRALSSTETLLIQIGRYKGVKLNGYYTHGDTPAPIDYVLSNTGAADDNGSVIVVGSIKLEHKFIDTLCVKYFGAKGNDTDDDTEALQNALSYPNVVVTIPAGTYLHRELTVKPETGFLIKGSGKNQTTLKYIGDSGERGITFDRQNNSSRNIFNSVVSDLTLDNNLLSSEVLIQAHFTTLDNIRVINGIGYNCYMYAQSSIIDKCRFTLTSATLTAESALYLKWNAHRVTRSYFNAQGNCPCIKIDSNVETFAETMSVLLDGNTLENFNSCGIQLSGNLQAVTISNNYLEAVVETAVGVLFETDGTFSNVNVSGNLLTEGEESVLIDKVNPLSKITIVGNRLYKNVGIIQNNILTTTGLSVNTLPDIVCHSNTVLFNANYAGSGVNRPAVVINELYGFEDLDIHYAYKADRSRTFKELTGKGFVALTSSTAATAVLPIYLSPNGGTTYTQTAYMTASALARKNDNGSNATLEVLERRAVCRNTGTMSKGESDLSRLITNGSSTRDLSFVINGANNTVDLTLTGLVDIDTKWFVDLTIRMGA